MLKREGKDKKPLPKSLSVTRSALGDAWACCLQDSLTPLTLFLGLLNMKSPDQWFRRPYGQFVAHLCPSWALPVVL